MDLPLDARLSLNYCLHSQDSEFVVGNPPVCPRICRVMITAPRRVVCKRRKGFEHPFSYGTVPFSITISCASLWSHGVAMPKGRPGVHPGCALRDTMWPGTSS